MRTKWEKIRKKKKRRQKNVKKKKTRVQEAWHLKAWKSATPIGEVAHDLTSATSVLLGVHQLLLIHPIHMAILSTHFFVFVSLHLFTLTLFSCRLHVSCASWNGKEADRHGYFILKLGSIIFFYGYNLRTHAVWLVDLFSLCACVCVCVNTTHPPFPLLCLSPNDWHALMFLQMRFLPLSLSLS